jgi:hypothetical protein
MTTGQATVDALSEEQVERWHRDGFLVLPRFVAGDDLEELRSAYDEVLTDGSAAGDRFLGALTRQVMNPASAHPVFDDNAALRAAMSIAGQLFGRPAARRFFDMLIYKPQGHAYDTPWHQDLAYAMQPFAPAGTMPQSPSAQFWIPLDDVDEENGCMCFASGYQDQPLMPHLVASGDPADDGRLLALVDPDLVDPARRVVAPIPAGGVTIHAPATPHYTGANHSTTRHRRAYIFNLVPEGPV